MDFGFANPLALLGLLLLPLLAVWYGVQMRRRGRIAAEFSNPVLAESVAPVQPGARRHVPAVIGLLAVTLLLLALAKPQRTVAVPIERAQIMLVTDVSGSMLADDVAPTRLHAAQQAALRFLDEAPPKVNIGVMTFNQTPTVLQSPTTDRDALRRAIDRYEAGGGTATGDAIVAALRALGATTVQDDRTRKRPPSAIVLLSDGVSTKGSSPLDAAELAKQAKVPISTVTLGTPSGTITVPRPRGQTGVEVRKVPPDPDTLREIASISGGRYFDAASSSDLTGVYRQLGSQLGRRRVKREMTAGFAGIAGLLALAGAALSLRWFGRLA